MTHRGPFQPQTFCDSVICILRWDEPRRGSGKVRTRWPLTQEPFPLQVCSSPKYSIFLHSGPQTSRFYTSPCGTLGMSPTPGQPCLQGNAAPNTQPHRPLCLPAELTHGDPTFFHMDGATKSFCCSQFSWFYQGFFYLRSAPHQTDSSREVTGAVFKHQLGRETELSPADKSTDQPWIYQQTRPSKKGGSTHHPSPSPWGKGGLAWGRGTAPFLQWATGAKPSRWGQDHGPGHCSQSCFSSSLRVLKGEICSEKPHISIKTLGEDGENRQAPDDG